MTDTAHQSELRGGIETVLDDLPCVQCGYNLKGLSAASVCPECGQDVVHSTSERKASGPRNTDNSTLGNAPGSYLRRLSLGLMLFGVGGFVTLVSTFAIWSGGLDAFSTIFALVGAMVWLTGVILTVVLKRPLPAPALSKNPKKPAPPQPTTEWFWLKAVALGTQSLWLIIPAFALMQYHGGVVAAYIKLALLLIAFIGCPVVALLLSFIADWARDTSIGNRLRGCGWCMGVLPIPIILAKISTAMGFPWSGYILLFVPMAVIVWIGSALLMLISSMQMLSMTFWAVRNAQEEAARNRRMLERAKRNRPGQIPEAFSGGIALGNGGILGGGFGTPAPAPAAESSVTPIQFSPLDGPVPGLSTPRINPSEQVEPYKLEDN